MSDVALSSGSRRGTDVHTLRPSKAGSQMEALPRVEVRSAWQSFHLCGPQFPSVARAAEQCEYGCGSLEGGCPTVEAPM